MSPHGWSSVSGLLHVLLFLFTLRAAEIKTYDGLWHKGAKGDSVYDQLATGYVMINI